MKFPELFEMKKEYKANKNFFQTGSHSRNSSSYLCQKYTNKTEIGLLFFLQRIST